VQWIALELDEAAHYENRPCGSKIQLGRAVFHAFQHSIQTVAG
jgi:hypothetical protein